MIYIIINTQDKENEFINLCHNIYKKSLTELIYCAIDFEYNKNYKTNERYIALAQIKFDKDENIYIFNLLKFRKKKKLIKYIFCSKLIKIFHGSDSLDYPHIYNYLSKNNKKFIKFINYSIDTLFLCNLYQTLTNKLKLTNNKKCNLYDALYLTQIIDNQKYNELINICSKINYNKNWFIHNLTENQIIYSSYDVIYSIELFKKLVLLLNYNNIISVINKIYRFHILCKLKIINNNETNKKQNKYISQNMTIIYENKKYILNVDIDDLLNITIIRKTIFYLLQNKFNDNIKLLKGYNLLLKYFI